MRPTSGSSAPAMYVVAHPDDTLLFQSPTILEHIADGRPVRTVFLSAGDDGADESYWAARERGVRNAYAQMAGVPSHWTDATVETPGSPLVLCTLDGLPTLSLVFLRLPDGGYPDGDGTAAHGCQSLKKLWQSTIRTIDAVDRSASYTRQSLVDTLAALMNDFEPGWIGTQDYVETYGDGDHADHYTTAYAVREAHEEYAAPHELVGFTGYGTARRPANVSGDLLQAKQEAFYTYGREDPLTCSDEQSCRTRPEGAWLQRQYLVDAGTPRRVRALRRIRRRAAAVPHP